MVDDNGGSRGPPVVVPRATAAPSGAQALRAMTPSRPPSISVATEGLRRPESQPGSPMDVDDEARSPAASSPSARSQKPVITVFDWDDTLCPSSWLYREGLLAGHGLVDDATEPTVTKEPSSFGGTTPTLLPRRRKLNTEDHHALRVLEESILLLLHTARQVGPVFIVTAAKLHWVRQCAEAFLPNVLQVLTKSESVHVISAREFYLDQSARLEPHHSRQAAEGTPLAWKAVTFEAVCSHLRVDEYVRRTRASNSTTRASTAPIVVDFVSVGDSLCERDACRFLATKAPHLLNSKTVKYLDQPSVLEIIEEIKMTKALFDQICRHTCSLDLCIARARSCLQMVQLDLTPRPPPPPPTQRDHALAPHRPLRTNTNAATTGVRNTATLLPTQKYAGESSGETTSL